MDDASTTTHVRNCLDRLKAGDESARQELFRHCGARLQRLAHKMLRGYPGVRRWEETGDVLQNALVRLLRALDNVSPESPRHFLNLASGLIRQELIDLHRHYYGPQGPGRPHA